MNEEFIYRNAIIADSKKLSILFMQVYIQTYGTEGISDEFANFITKQFSVERLEKLISEHPENLIVAEYKSNLVGAVEIEFNKKCPINKIAGPELNKIYVLEWFCGKGVGNGLLDYAEKIIKEKNQKLFWLWVLESNIRAIKFYEKHDYKWIGNATFQMEKNSYLNKVMVKTF
jgi:ribosomal protein S18 acetylase RimI-like enzyme